MRRLLWASLVSLGLLVALACRPAATPTPAPAAAPTPAPAPTPKPPAERVIKFGIATPLSGPAAPWGIAHVRTYEMIFDQINAAGGLTIGGETYTLKVVAYDHKYVIADAVAAVNKLIYDDKVKYISVLGGAVVKALEEPLRESKALHLTLAYAEGIVHPRNPLQFMYYAMPPESGRVWFWVKQTYPEVKKVASITPNDETGWWSIKISNELAVKAGLEVVSREFFERGITDFVPMLLRMLAQKPDLIDTTASPAGSVGLIVKQARELGYKGRFAHWGQVNMSVVAKTAGVEATEGFLAHGYVDEPLPEGAKAWVDAYLKKYGSPFDPTTLDFSAGPYVLTGGLKAANSLDPVQIADALRKTEFDVPWGKARFGGKEYYGIGNQLVYELPISEYRGGVAKLVTRLPVPYKE